MKLSIFGMLLIIFPFGLLGQSWVDSFGLRSPYQPPQYVSGYGFSDLPSMVDRTLAAQNAALSQLTQTIRVSVRAVDNLYQFDTETTSLSRFTSTVQTSTDLQLLGVRYEVVNRGNVAHALAWIEIPLLRATYQANLLETEQRILSSLRTFDSSLSLGQISNSRSILAQTEAQLIQITDMMGVIQALDDLARRSRVPTDRLVNLGDLEEQIQNRRQQLTGFQPATMEQAAILLTYYLNEQLMDKNATILRVAPFLFQDSDFSSGFGSRMAELLETHISHTFGSGMNQVVIRGSFWPDEQQIELSIAARSIQTGQVLAGARTSIPLTAVPANSIQPDNIDTAIEAGRILSQDPISLGGLDIEVWTNKGRNERSLVFQQDEEVQFYFRVNQPAFLQLTYVLATGETVLLEESFYIGIDRVNRVVELPTRFRVTPPFGVERLIVTGFSSRPPQPDVIPRSIGGVLYEVYRSVDQAVVRARGLSRITQTSTGSGSTEIPERVGEAHITITTIAKNR